MKLDAGQLRWLQQVAAGRWNKLSKYRKGEMVDLGLVEVVDDTPKLTPFGERVLKEQS